MLLCDLERSEGRVFDVLVLTISFSIFAELHEAVASGLPRLNILHNVDMLNFADDAIEGLPEGLLTRLVVEPAHEHSAIRVSALGILIVVRTPYIQFTHSSKLWLGKTGEVV